MTALAALAAAALAGPAAQAGEALPEELPSMRTPVPEGVFRTRDEVREALATARQTRLITPDGEIGDTTEVLDLRETFNALQTEVLPASPVAPAPASAPTPASAPAPARAVDPQPVMSIGQLFYLMDRAAVDGSVVMLMLGRGP